MYRYVFILVWIGFIAFISYITKFKRKYIVCGETVSRYTWLFAFVAFLPILLMAAARGRFADTSTYIYVFTRMPSTISGISEYLSTVPKDIGFYFFSVVLKQIIGDRIVLYLTFIAIVQSIVLISILKRYSCNYIISLFLFIASSDYISWMFNGIRQFMAVTIIFAATPLMLRKKYIPLLIVILLAATFHQSALIMIPFVIIAQGKAWNKRTLFYVFLTIVAVAFVGQFEYFLNDTLSNTQYANVISDYTSWNDDGTHPLRVALYSVPALLAFIGRKKINIIENPLINFCSNMSILSMGLYIVSMVTSGIFLGRLPIYASLYGYILLPWEIENLFTKGSKKIVYIAMIIIYIVYYYYQMHITYRLF